MTRKYDRLRDQQRRYEVAGLLDAYKVARGCADCGYNRHPQALHFDHIKEGTKSLPGWKENRSRLRTRAQLTAYIAHVETYCVLRCANCHAERTATEKHWTWRQTHPVTPPPHPGERAR